MHAEAIVADRRAVFIGSENLSSTSLDQNREMGLVLAETAAITAVERAFDAGWQGVATAGPVPFDVGVGHADAIGVAGQRHEVRGVEHTGGLRLDGVNDVGHGGAVERIEAVVAAHVGDGLEGDAAYHLLRHAEAHDLPDLILVAAPLDRRRQVDGDLVFW